MAVVEMPEFRKDPQRSGRSRNDELQPDPLLRKQRLAQCCAEAAQPNVYSRACVLYLLKSGGVLHSQLYGERKPGKSAFGSVTILRSGGHEALVYHTTLRASRFRSAQTGNGCQPADH